MNTAMKSPAALLGRSGMRIELQAGEYTADQLAVVDWSGIGTLEVAPGYQAIAYAGDHFSGDSRVIVPGTTETGCLAMKGQAASEPFRSLRVMAAAVEDAELRDRRAVAQVVAGWWPDSLRGKESRIAWWREARFGCFIHWGVYSLTGGRWNGEPSRGYAEHLMRARQIDLETYKKELVERFNPENFDAEMWVRAIKAAGMKYVVITAKHHDGFAIYPSDVYPYDIRMTPFARDPLQELKEACGRHGLAYGFYYSHAFDWEHPDAPGNDWEYTNPGGDLKLYEAPGQLWHGAHPELLPRVAEYYVNGKAIPQILELIRRYEPDILWFDTPHKLPLSENLRILQAIREADDRVVVNGRLAAGQGFDSFADYINTADRALEIFPCEGDWETIPTTNESYGYSADDHSHKPAGVFIQLLAKSAARGGNVLMNLGPTGDGRIDSRDEPILREIGEWLAVNGDSVYGTQKTPLPVQSWGESTRKGNIVYLHVFDWPSDGKLVLGGVKNHIRKAWLLADPAHSSLQARRVSYCDWVIDVPVEAPDNRNSVVAVEIVGAPAVHGGRLISDQQANMLRAFDAEVSQGIAYGDGKRGNDYIRGWSSPSQFVKWNIRLNRDGVYKLRVTYGSAGSACGGSYAVCLGDWRVEDRVVNTAAPDLVQAEYEVALSAGKHDLTITPMCIEGEELMRLYSVALLPISSSESQRKPLDELDTTDVGD